MAEGSVGSEQQWASFSLLLPHHRSPHALLFAQGLDIHQRAQSFPFIPLKGIFQDELGK